MAIFVPVSAPASPATRISVRRSARGEAAIRSASAAQAAALASDLARLHAERMVLELSLRVLRAPPDGGLAALKTLVRAQHQALEEP